MTQVTESLNSFLSVPNLEKFAFFLTFDFALGFVTPLNISGHACNKANQVGLLIP